VKTNLRRQAAVAALARIFNCNLRNRGPVERVAASGEQSQKAVANQAGKRKWNAELFAGRKNEPDIF